IRAAQKVGDKIRRVAANLLQVEAKDIRLSDGKAMLISDPQRSVSFREIAEITYSIGNGVLPEGEDFGLEASEYYDPPVVTIANAVHIVQVAVDALDGRVAIENYSIVHDCGRVINPMIVDGQIHGGVAQGI